MNICKTFQEFESALRKHEIDNVQKFVIGNYGKKNFVSEKIQISKGLRLHWLDDVPYFHFGTRTYACHHGRDHNVYQKKQYAMKRDAKVQSDHCFTKHQRKVQVTKKLNCPATIHVTRIYRLPNYKVGRCDIDENVIETSCSNQSCPSALILEPVATNINEAAGTKVLNGDPDNNETSLDKLGHLKLRKSNKKLLINKFNANIRSLQSLVWNLNEENIQKCSLTLENLFNEMSFQVETDRTGLLITNTTEKVNRKRTVADVLNDTEEEETSQVYGKLPQRPKKILKRFGAHADAMKEAAIINVSKYV